MTSQPETRTPQTWISALAATVILAPILTYYALLAATSVNVPYLDDYDTILAYLELHDIDTPPLESLERLVAPHVEHRIALVRGAALLDHTTTGAVDFRWLSALGNLGLLVFAAMLFLVFRHHDAAPNRLLLFAPVAFLLFQPQAWDAWFWATSSLSNLWVLPLALSTFIALDRSTPTALILALILGVITILTQANGLLVLPLGAGVLWLGRKPRLALGWLAFGALVFVLYVWNLHRPTDSPTLFESVTSIIPVLHYALNFLGSAAGFGNPIASFLAGLFIVCSALLLCVRNGRKNPPLYGLLLLLLASALLNALAREHIRGPEYALDAWRYRSYAAAAMAVTYLGWAESNWTSRRQLSWVSICLTLGIAFNVLSYASVITKVQSVSQQLKHGVASWQSTGFGLRHPDPAHAKQVLETAIREGIYRPPAESLR